MERLAKPQQVPSAAASLLRDLSSQYAAPVWRCFPETHHAIAQEQPACFSDFQPRTESFRSRAFAGFSTARILRPPDDPDKRRAGRGRRGRLRRRWCIYRRRAEQFRNSNRGKGRGSRGNRGQIGLASMVVPFQTIYRVDCAEQRRPSLRNDLHDRHFMFARFRRRTAFRCSD